jgi:hypothetical protein
MKLRYKKRLRNSSNCDLHSKVMRNLEWSRKISDPPKFFDWVCFLPIRENRDEIYSCFASFRSVMTDSK